MKIDNFLKIAKNMTSYLIEQVIRKENRSLELENGAKTRQSRTVFETSQNSVSTLLKTTTDIINPFPKFLYKVIGLIFMIHQHNILS